MVYVYIEKKIKISVRFNDNDIPTNLIQKVWKDLTKDNGTSYIHQFELNGCQLIVWDKKLKSEVIELATKLEKSLCLLSKMKTYEKFLKVK